MIEPQISSRNKKLSQLLKIDLTHNRMYNVWMERIFSRTADEFYLLILFLLLSSAQLSILSLTCLGADTTNVKLADAGLLLSDALRDFMHSTGVDNGLTALGYQPEDIPALVKGTLPQHRVTKLAPAGAPGEDELARLFEDSMTVY